MLILKSYFTFLCVISIFYIIGAIFTSLLIKEVKNYPWYLKAFIVLLIGSIITITVFSVWKTEGVTINILFIFLIFCLILQKKELRAIAPIKNSQNSFNGKHFIFLVLSSIAIFSYCVSISPQESQMPDHIFYSRISFFLNTGQENEFYIANTLDKNFHGTSPYHYYELWLNSFINENFGGLSLNNFVLITQCILLQMIFIGTLSIWERYSQVNFFSLIITFLLLFSGGLTFFFFEKIPLIRDFHYVGFSMLLTNPIKYAVVSIFPLAAFLTALYKQKILPVIFLLFLPIVNFTFLPALLGGIILFCFISLCVKHYTFNEAVKTIFYAVAIPILIFSFYHFFSIQEITRDSTSLKSILDSSNIPGVDTVKTMANIIFGGSLSILALYVLHIILIMYLFIKKYTGKEVAYLGLMVLCISFSGLVSWSLIFKALNSSQLFNITLKCINITLIGCSIIILSNFLNERFPKKHYWLIFALIIFTPLSQIIYKVNHLNTPSQKYHAEYLNNVDHFIKSSHRKLGVFIKDSTDYYDPFTKYPSFSVLGEYLGSMDNNAIAISLSEFNVPLNYADSISLERDLKAIKMGIFYQFVQEEKKKNTFTSIENSQLNFIKKFKIKYLILSSKSQIPDFIKKRILKVFEDKKSGEKFLVLKDFD